MIDVAIDVLFIAVIIVIIFFFGNTPSPFSTVLPMHRRWRDTL